MFHDFLVKPYLYLIIILIGISLKFFQLDYKLFWFDEVCTIQHTSGISDKEYPSLVSEGDIKNIDFYIDLYRLNKQNYSLSSELKGLVTSTQLNPMYYPFVMIWYRIAGDTPFDYRLFSVIIFIISLPFLFLLSRKLFKSKLAGWIAVSLYSISPYIHLFAQEARHYIFWSLVLIIMHYIFLQVIHHNKTKWWLAYILISVMSLYASPISIIIILGHAAFILLTQKKLIKSYIISGFVVFLLYLPWTLSLYFKLDEITSALSWHSKNQHNFNLYNSIFGEFLYIISNFSYNLDYLSVLKQSSFIMTQEMIIAIISGIIILAIICVSVFFLFKKTSKNIIYFLILIIIPGLLFFYVNDIIRNGIASWWWRYLIFISTGIFLLITNLLYRKIEKGSITYFLWFLAIVVIGISSILSIAKAKYWHLGGDGMNNYIEISNLISEAENPLIITDFSKDKNMINFVVVMQECTSNTIDILKVTHTNESLVDLVGKKKYSDVYVIYASNELVNNLKMQFGNNMDLLNFESASNIWTIDAKGKK